MTRFLPNASPPGYLTELECAFLAGLLYARGSFTISRAVRGDNQRYVPCVAFEVRHRLPESGITKLFGEPTERRYYAAPSWRYSVQNREQVGRIASTFAPALPGELRARLETLAAFCHAETPAERDQCYSHFMKLATE